MLKNQKIITMFGELKKVIDLIENSIKQKNQNYDISIRSLYLSFDNDIVGWLNPIVSLSDKGYRYVYEYEKTDWRQVNIKYSIKQQISYPGRVYIYNIVKDTFEYIELYKTCLQTLFIPSNDRQYNTFHHEFNRLNNLRLCDSLMLRINDIRKVLNYVLYKRSELLPVLLNIGDDFKKEYIKENVNFKKIFLNTVLFKISRTLNATSEQNKIQTRAIFEISIDIGKNVYSDLLKFVTRSHVIYYSNHNEFHECYNIPKNRVDEVLSNFFTNNLIEQFKAHYKDITYDVFLVSNTVTDKKWITLFVDLPFSNSLFTDALVYISMPSLKYI